ncbi:MAG: prenyltransferase, partial [Chloroflexota bacterium]
ALMTAIFSVVLTSTIGVYFVFNQGLALLPLGLIGLLIILTYSVWLVRNPILCLLAPGLGFGTLMVNGTAFILTGNYSWTAFFASLVPFFLVCNLLLLNQFPDVEADREVGRRNLPILLGKQTSSLIYGVFLLFTYLSILIGVLLNFLPKNSLLGLSTLLLAVPAFMGARTHADTTEKLIPSLGMNVLVNILTPVLVAIGFLL